METDRVGEFPYHVYSNPGLVEAAFVFLWKITNLVSLWGVIGIKQFKKKHAQSTDLAEYNVMWFKKTSSKNSFALRRKSFPKILKIQDSWIWFFFSYEFMSAVAENRELLLAARQDFVCRSGYYLYIPAAATTIHGIELCSYPGIFPKHSKM